MAICHSIMGVMRDILVVLFILASFSCKTSQYCKESKNYLKRVNLSKPYWVDGIYCIQKEEIKDIEKCKITLNIYDRISGNLIEEGTAFFTDSLKVKISSGKASVIVPPGNYNVGITSVIISK